MAECKQYSEEYEEFIQTVEDNIEDILESNPEREFRVPKLAKKYISKFDDTFSSTYNDFADSLSSSVHKFDRKYSGTPYDHPALAAQFSKALERMGKKGIIERNNFRVRYND